MKKDSIRVVQTSHPAGCTHLVLELNGEKISSTFAEVKSGKKIWQKKLNKFMTKNNIQSAFGLRDALKVEKSL